MLDYLSLVSAVGNRISSWLGSMLAIDVLWSAVLNNTAHGRFPNEDLRTATSYML